MCATCLNEPAVGPDIIDLSILPPLLGLDAFFFFAPSDLDLPALTVRRNAGV